MQRNHLISTLLLTSAIASSSASQTTQLSAVAQSEAADSLEVRLGRLLETLDAERERVHVPGLALAIVKDDELILATGLGLADREARTPVNPETIFAIGSTTKAFTTTLVAMLAEEGKLGWDDPITKHVPHFELALDSEDEDAELTLRDLLSHRTGFTRMSALWAGTDASRDEILRTAVKAEAWDTFRESFLYNNVMYLAGGMAAGEAAGLSWEELLTQRLIEPLGMTSTTYGLEAAQKDPRLAKGYQWMEDREEFEVKRMIPLESIGPAGAINSNVLDMARWVQFLLARGAVDGKRLMRAESLEQLWSKQIDVGPDVGYGLGWFVREYDGQLLVEHGGNIDGFAAQVSLLPDSGLGYVLLANVGATELQNGSIGMVFDALLKDPVEPAEEGGLALDAYVGKYAANFGAFDDVDFEVSIESGQLAVDVPGQTLYLLKSPDEEGKWYFQLTDAIAIDFERDEAGNVVLMKMYQGGMTFEIPRRGVEQPIEVPLDQLEPYLGVYKDPAFEENLEVVVMNQHLAVDVPGQMVYELHPPSEDGTWVLRVTDALSVRFEEEDSVVVGLTFNERGTERFCKRLEGPGEAEPLPTLADLVELRNMDERRALWSETQTSRRSGTVRLAQAGIEGRFELATKGRVSYRLDIDLGSFGYTNVGVSAEGGWMESSARGFEPMTEQQLGQLRGEHPAALAGDWRLAFDSVLVTGVGEHEGRKTIQVKLVVGDAPAHSVELDAESGDLLRSSTTRLGGKVQVPVKTTYSDYREVNGLRLPHRVVSSNPFSGRTILVTESIDFGVPIDDGVFGHEDS